jgi:Mg2+-importing ATPase
MLQTSLTGLTTDEARRRLAQFGPNALEARERATALKVFLRQFSSPIVVILLGATVLSALLADYTDALIILAIVLASAILSFVQEYSAGNAVARLQQQLSVTATVLRDGRQQEIPAAEVVPGDIILLSAGDLVPADGVVLEARDFFVNQAVLTGETFPAEKHPGTVPEKASLAERTNMIFMGTIVHSGIARVLIVATGRRTAFGQIAHRLRVRPPETEFERGVRRLGYLLSEVMFVLVLVIFAVNVLLDKPVLDSLLFSVALAVGLTPQLLPAIISINLSRGAQAMARQGVIVRRLVAIENFGSMDVLCTDKTGTLTVGVVQLDAALDVAGNPSADVLCYAYINARLQTGLRNPLDEAILKQAGMETASVEKVDEIPYDFVRKRLTVVVRESGAPAPLLITKGALAQVLAACTKVAVDGQVVPLSESHRQEIERRFAAWSEQGYRVLGVAVRPVPEPKDTYTRDDEREMTFVGFLLFFDPPKEDVGEVLADLAALGVKVKIITGDNCLVARHVAETVGLPVRGILTGADLDAMHDEALWRAVEETTIFAEVDPNQKERIIHALQKMGHVVGYMGDGINDAPPLHAADVGISVDTAVDVAKDAADLVLLRRDLTVLHQGIVEGRRTFANTLKYVFMATSANFGNMFSMAGASLLLPFLPMLPKQILLINFLTDLPELTIATDAVDEERIARPRRWDVGFIRRFMLVFGPLSSVFDYATFGVLLWIAGADQALFHTGWFVESVLSAGLVVFALRTRLPIRRSRPGRALLFTSLAVGIVTVLLPYIPVVALFGFRPLPSEVLGLVFLIVLAYLLAAELLKRRFYRRSARIPMSGKGG